MYNRTPESPIGKYYTQLNRLTIELKKPIIDIEENRSGLALMGYALAYSLIDKPIWSLLWKKGVFPNPDQPPTSNVRDAIVNFPNLTQISEKHPLHILRGILFLHWFTWMSPKEIGKILDEKQTKRETGNTLRITAINFFRDYDLLRNIKTIKFPKGYGTQKIFIPNEIETIGLLNLADHINRK